MCTPARRGATLLNVLVGIGCIVVLLCVFSYWTRSGPRRGSRMTRDATQIRGIHQSWLVFSNEHNGTLPTPGLARRLPFNAVLEPGRGPEDTSQNTTANLYSLCIMSKVFAPEMCVGASEPSPRVKVCEDYNYEAFSLKNGVYWDSNFRADLHHVSHVSYAHMPICGTFQSREWKQTSNPFVPILGTRGPRNGVHDPNSITNRIFPPDDTWNGVVCYNDNHTGICDTFTPKGNDNIFAFDRPGSELDAMLTFTKAIKPNGDLEIEHD